MKKLFRNLILLLATTAVTAQVDSLNMTAYLRELVDSTTIYYDSGNYSKSLEFNIKIIQTAEAAKDTSYLQSGYRFLGYDYLILEDTIQARESFEKSQEYASLTQDDLALGLSYMDLANLYGYSKKSLNKALDYHDKSIVIFKKLHDSINLSNAYLNTVLTLNEHGLYDRSFVYLQEADKLKYYLNNGLRAKVQNEWAYYYLRRNDFKKAEYYLSEFEKDTLLHESSFELASGYRNYSRSLFGQKRYKEAYTYALKYQTLYEQNINKLQSEESQKVLANFQVSEYKKDIEKKELKNQLQAEIVTSKNRQNIFLTIVVLISLLLLLSFFINYLGRKKFIKQLTEKNQEYLKAKEESEELSKSKTSFFSTVSHELRTPLYGVIGLSTILMDDPTLKSHEQDIKSLKFSADYLLALINDVLQINKIDSKSIEENDERFEIRDFIKNISSSFEYMRIQNNNVIHIHIDDGIPPIIKGDATRLSQILMNLIGNACKFTENGRIDIILEHLGTEANQSKIKFSIKDTGSGIPQEKQASVFDEFSQLKSRDYTYQGTGLGLPIVKKLLKLMGSNIFLISREGEGSTFYFELSFITEEEFLPKRSVAITNEHIIKNKRILIVDDNRINQIVTSKILQKLEVTYELANNGLEAIDQVRNNHFDLVLMDIHMPLMDGMQATTAIRKFNPAIPIIALTAVEIEEMRFKIYASGMSDIIIKPYDILLFKRTILRNLMHPHDSDKTALNITDSN